MRFVASALLVLASAVAISADQPVDVRYDTVYDDPKKSTLSMACSDGINGLYTKGFPDLYSLGGFPNVGASATIEGWDSRNCGACYKLSYDGRMVYVTAVDHSANGFVLSGEAMRALTGGVGLAIGVIKATYAEADREMCKIQKTE